MIHFTEVLRIDHEITRKLSYALTHLNRLETKWKAQPQLPSLETCKAHVERATSLRLSFGTVALTCTHTRMNNKMSINTKINK